MAQIRARRQADGATRYTAIIRIRKGTTLIQQEYRTFAQRSAAASWAKHREVQLENQAVPGRRQHDPITLAALIRWYIETFETISKWQRSKQSHLEFLERHAIGKVNALELTAAALIGHVRRRRADGVGPATVMNDLIWIGVVLRAASNVKELPVRPEIAQEARDACATLRLIGKARKRARRQAEITRLEWADNDEIGRTGLVRDAKHPLHNERSYSGYGQSRRARSRKTARRRVPGPGELRAVVNGPGPARTRRSPPACCGQPLAPEATCGLQVP